MIRRLAYYFFVFFIIGVACSTMMGQVISYDTKIKIAKDYKKTKEVTVLVQINGKEENRLSHVELSHNPKQKFGFKYAQVYDKKGQVVKKINKKELKTRNDLSHQTFYQDDLITEFDLYWNEYPYRIQYSYTLEEEEYLYIALWTPLYYTGVSTLEASLEVDIPVGRPLRMSGAESFEFSESEREGRKILVWRSAEIKPESREEVFAPPVEWPMVRIVPIDFKYGISGKSESWSTFGNWLYELNLGTDQLPLQEKWTLEKMLDGLTDRKEKVKAIYHYLQDQTKYVNVAIDVGGLKSFPAWYVSKNKYGDCKALTTFMKAMLQSIGIESLYTIVRSGDKIIEIDPNLPSQQFDHVILMVPLDGDTIWLENTSNSLPFGYIGTFTQGRQAFAIDAERSHLVSTPHLTQDEVRSVRNYTFRALENNEVEIDLHFTLRGQEFEQFRYFLVEKDEIRQKTDFRNQSGIKDFTMNSWGLVDFHRDSTFLNLNAKGLSPAIIRQISNIKAINPLRIALPEFKSPSERKQAVKIDFPIYKTDKSIYYLELYENHEFQIPESLHLENKYGVYAASYSKVGNELTVEEKFSLHVNKISVEEYPEFFKFVEAINNYKKKSAILIK